MDPKDHETLASQAALYTQMIHGAGLDKLAAMLEELPEPEYPGPPCRSTQDGLGCGHGTLEHTQGMSPHIECCCCTGRANDPLHIAEGCRQCDVRQGRSDDTPSHEELADILGVGTADVARILIELTKTGQDNIENLKVRVNPQPVTLNRAERRRRQGKGGRNAGAFGVKVNRKRHK